MTTFDVVKQHVALNRKPFYSWQHVAQLVETHYTLCNMLLATVLQATCCLVYGAFRQPIPMYWGQLTIHGRFFFGGGGLACITGTVLTMGMILQYTPKSFM